MKALPTTDDIEKHDLVDVNAMCVLVGGNRPVNRATVYRAVKAGRLPRPVMVTPNVARWVRSEVEAAIRERMAARRL